MWLARDKNKKLYLYNKKPYRRYDDEFSIASNSTLMIIPSAWFPKVTWENSPKHVKYFSLRKPPCMTIEL